MFPGITAPGCMLSTSTGALLWEITVLPPATVVGTVPLAVPHGFEGVDLYAQYVVLDGGARDGTLDVEPEQRYLLVCAHGVRSHAAAEFLRARGHPNVWSLQGGLAGQAR